MNYWLSVILDSPAFKGAVLAVAFAAVFAAAVLLLGGSDG